MRRYSFIAVAITAVMLVACGGAGSASPSPSSASPSPAIQGIDHPTGSTDVVLRLEEGGGFVPIWFLTTQAPTFTLYGDGTVVFRDIDVSFPEPRPDGTTVHPAFSTGRLDEAAVQELLEFAIGPGGLGLARNGRYDHPNVADASTSYFDLEAGGHKKRVEVYALDLQDPGVPDATARAAFRTLADRLRHFGGGVSVPPADYVPERYRAVLFESEGPGAAARPWPWTTISDADFVADPDGLGLPRLAMTPEDIAVLGIDSPLGGVSGISVTSPDGTKTYLFSARPLFPDETS
jgi:hypothetical protein